MTYDDLVKLLKKSIYILKYYGDSRPGHTWLTPTSSPYAQHISHSDLEQIHPKDSQLVAGRRARAMIKEIEERLKDAKVDDWEL